MHVPRLTRSILRRTLILTVAILGMALWSAAQSPDPPARLLDAYRAQRTNWFTNVQPAANALFGLLALIDFAWSAAVMVLEKQDFHSWVSAVIRKLMTLGAFYALLVYGRVWIPAIIDSFEILGQNAAGSGPLDPGGVFMRGLNLAGALIDGAASAGLFTNFGAALALVFASVMCLLGFCVITIQFVVAMVESYILVAAAFIFLGFGGSRWSSPYVERYIGLAVSIGVKILLLYLLIGTGMNVSLSWLADAERIAFAARPATVAFSIMGSSIIFAALCWQAPKLIIGVLGGSPSFHGSDLISTVTTVGTGAAILGSGAYRIGSWVTGAGSGMALAAHVAKMASGTTSAGAATASNTPTPRVVPATGPVGAAHAGGTTPPPPKPQGGQNAATNGSPPPPPTTPQAGTAGP